jgi:hypothetical protein
MDRLRLNRDGGVMSMFLHRSGMMAGLDPLTVAYAAASGATSLAGIDAIIRYARAESLLNNIRLYPMKSAQNAGTGTTVYGIGSLTANNMTLVNGPTWGAGGLAFVAASSQYGSIDDFLPGGNLTIFDRFTIDLPQTNDSCIVRQGEGTDRSFSVLTNTSSGGRIALSRSSDGGFTNFEAYLGDDNLFDNIDVTAVFEWIEGGGRNLYANKTAVSLSLAAGSAQTSRYNSTAPIGMMARGLGGTLTNFLSGTKTATVFCTASLTTTQRETLTDMINAL